MDFKNARINALSLAVAQNRDLSRAEMAVYGGLRVKSRGVRASDKKEYVNIKVSQLDRHLARIRDQYPSIAQAAIALGKRIAKENIVGSFVRLEIPHSAVDDLAAGRKGSILGDIEGNDDEGDGDED